MNKVFLIGHVGQDPEVHTFEDGSAIANFSLATKERGYKLQNGTEVPERTDWHRIVMKGSTAKTVEKYVHKGDRLAIVGKVSYRDYDDRNGNKIHVTEIICHEMEMLSSKQSQSQNNAPQAQNNAPRQEAEPFPPQGETELPF
jgi:single-strand DNA-binding protein